MTDMYVLLPWEKEAFHKPKIGVHIQMSFYQVDIHLFMVQLPEPCIMHTTVREIHDNQVLVIHTCTPEEMEVSN